MIDLLGIISSPEAFNEFIIFVEEHQYLIAVLTPILTGEVGIYFISVLFGSGDTSLFAVLLMFLSVVFYDTAVFLGVKCIRRYGLFRKQIECLSVPPFLVGFCNRIKEYELEYQSFPLLLLFVLKVLPFTKITIFFFALRYRMTVLQFIIRDMIVTILWGGCIFIPGVLIGRQLLTESEGRTIGMFLTAFILFLLLSIIASPYIERLAHRGMAYVTRRR